MIKIFDFGGGKPSLVEIMDAASSRKLFSISGGTLTRSAIIGRFGNPFDNVRLDQSYMADKLATVLPMHGRLTVYPDRVVYFNMASTGSVIERVSPGGQTLFVELKRGEPAAGYTCYPNSRSARPLPKDDLDKLLVASPPAIPSEGFILKNRDRIHVGMNHEIIEPSIGIYKLENPPNAPRVPVLEVRIS